MNRQVNPDHDRMKTPEKRRDLYMLESDVQVDGTRDSPEWHVLKDGRKHRTFTSLMAAKGWLEHVIEYPESDGYHAHEPSTRRTPIDQALGSSTQR